MYKGLLALALGLCLLSMVQAQRSLNELTRSKEGTELVVGSGGDVKNISAPDSSAKDPVPSSLKLESGGTKKSAKSGLRVVQRPAPSSRENKEEGLVVLPSGKIDSVAVAQSSGYPALDQAAVKAAEGIIFKPGEDNASSGPVTLRVPYDFKLRRK